MEFIKNKWILLDTNVLLKAARDPSKFTQLFSFIEKYNCKLAYNQMIRAEFLQSIWKPELITKAELFLENLKIIDIPFNNFKELTDLAMEATRKLRKNKKNLPGLIDSYLISLIKFYNGNLLLLTSNHKDFAYSLNRFHIETIEFNEEEITNYGFYR